MFLVQHVNEYTRYREGCTPSLLDLVFSAEELMVDNVSTTSPIGKSDHVVLTWEFIYANDNRDKGRNKTRPCLDYRKGNYRDLALALNQVDWSVMEEMNVERSWKYFSSKLEELVAKFVPLVKPTLNQHCKPPWWHKRLEVIVKRKHKAWKEYVE